MKYFKGRYYIYALDEGGNLFVADNDKHPRWQHTTEEMSPLEAVIRYGDAAFPPQKTKTKKDRIIKILGWPFHLIAYLFGRVEERGAFAAVTSLITLLAVLFGVLISLGLYESSRRPVVGRTSIPSGVVVQYEDGSSLLYPIKNVKPEAVKVEAK